MNPASKRDCEPVFHMLILHFRNLRISLTVDNALSSTYTKRGAEVRSDLGIVPYSMREESKVATGLQGRWDWRCLSTHELLRAASCRMPWKQPFRCKHGYTVISSITCQTVPRAKVHYWHYNFSRRFRQWKTNCENSQLILDAAGTKSPLVSKQLAADT